MGQGASVSQESVLAIAKSSSNYKPPLGKANPVSIVVIFIFPLKYFIGAVWFGLPLDHTQANPLVFLDMAVDGKPLGRVVLELKEDVVPRTA
jgi:hypothetical protein